MYLFTRAGEQLSRFMTFLSDLFFRITDPLVPLGHFIRRWWHFAWLVPSAVLMWWVAALAALTPGTRFGPVAYGTPEEYKWMVVFLFALAGFTAVLLMWYFEYDKRRIRRRERYGYC